MQLTRRDFLKDMAFTAAIVGLPKWTMDLDEAPPMEMMSLAPNSYPWQWSPSADIGQGNPIITTLNRIAFGPRPGDFERVQAMGIDAYIDEQLYPEKIDDTVLDQKIAQMYPTLSMSNADLMRDYPQPRPLSPEERAYRAFRASEQGVKPYTPPGPNDVIADLDLVSIPGRRARVVA